GIFVERGDQRIHAAAAFDDLPALAGDGFAVGRLGLETLVDIARESADRRDRRAQIVYQHGGEFLQLLLAARELAPQRRLLHGAVEHAADRLRPDVGLRDVVGGAALERFGG